LLEIRITDVREKQERPQAKDAQGPINDSCSCFGGHGKSLKNGPQNIKNIEINQNQYG
jgi:hypothetical protein